MNQEELEKKNNKIHFIRRRNNILNRTIWLWSCGKNLTKREIQDYAIKVYQDAGVKSFKASDGWYRHWLSKWKNNQNIKDYTKTDNIYCSKRLIKKKWNLQSICDHIEETSTVKRKCHSEVLNTSNINKDCNEINSSNKSDINTQNIISGLPSLIEEQYIEDCNKTERLPECIITEKRSVPFKSNNGKYFPHFKTKVTSYALKHSIKDAASVFKVNKDTISDWLRQSKPLSLKTPKNNDKILACLFQDEAGPEDEFIEWLKSSGNNCLISRQSLIEKVNEVVKAFEKLEKNKKSSWFLLYAERLNDDKAAEKIKIKYPIHFKREIANYANNFSKKMISKIFNIDRKRICEWVSYFKSESIKKRDVSKYLTDPDVDKKIWDWYCLQKDKPTSREIRLKATLLFEEAGYPGMRCSPGWYYRWRMRHHLPQARTSLASRDNELLIWVLQQIDRNKSILHSDILKQASLFKGSDFKASPSWVFRFIKRYKSHLQPGSLSILLPGELSEQAENFKNIVTSTIRKNNYQNYSIVAFDEIPLNLTESSKNIVSKSGWDNCQASVIVTCLANGTLLPTGLILKEPIEENIYSCEEVQPLFQQDTEINNRVTMETWFHNILRYLDQSAVIICDAYEPHFILKDLLKNVCNERNIELMIIPSGCSSQLQPVMFGIRERFQDEMENHYQRWCHETSFSGFLKLRVPSSKQIYEWVQKTHLTMASNCEDLIKKSFVHAGIISSL